MLNNMKTAEAITHFGSIPALARALGIARQAIYQWGETVPVGRAFQIQVITNGVLVAKPVAQPEREKVRG